MLGPTYRCAQDSRFKTQLRAIFKRNYSGIVQVTITTRRDAVNVVHVDLYDGGNWDSESNFQSGSETNTTSGR